ncbi:hypothetical protein EV401DRAFT_2068473 [Pisolithus croceorrhizus]|nr:hypothetical protein EV401DRAFT_2068473 [Pisolithus croceorrhizus]
MPPQLQSPTFIPTPVAAFAVPLCQIHYGVPADARLPLGEHIVGQGEISDDCPQGDFLLEGPWFSGYHTQIADNGSNGSVLLHDSVPSPIAGPFNGAEGNFLLAHPNLLGAHPEHR